jgi:hypothetical protein
MRSLATLEKNVDVTVHLPSLPANVHVVAEENIEILIRAAVSDIETSYTRPTDPPTTDKVNHNLYKLMRTPPGVRRWSVLLDLTGKRRRIRGRQSETISFSGGVLSPGSLMMKIHELLTPNCRKDAFAAAQQGI